MQNFWEFLEHFVKFRGNFATCSLNFKNFASIPHSDSPKNPSQLPGDLLPPQPHSHAPNKMQSDDSQQKNFIGFHLKRRTGGGMGAQQIPFDWAKHHLTDVRFITMNAKWAKIKIAKRKEEKNWKNWRRVVWVALLLNEVIGST